jgi:hypothetical protein
MVTAPIRLQETALDTRKALGRLDREQMRALVEGFVTYCISTPTHLGPFDYASADHPRSLGWLLRAARTPS